MGHKIKSINQHILRVKKIEVYLRSQFIKHKNSRKNLKKLMKVYLKTKKAGKILQNEKLNKISKNLITSVQRSIHNIKTLKHNVRNIQNPQAKKNRNETFIERSKQKKKKKKKKKKK